MTQRNKKGLHPEAQAFINPYPLKAPPLIELKFTRRAQAAAERRPAGTAAGGAFSGQRCALLLDSSTSVGFHPHFNR